MLVVEKLPLKEHFRNSRSDIQYVISCLFEEKTDQEIDEYLKEKRHEGFITERIFGTNNKTIGVRLFVYKNKYKYTIGRRL